MIANQIDIRTQKRITWIILVSVVFVEGVEWFGDRLPAGIFLPVIALGIAAMMFLVALVFVSGFKAFKKHGSGLALAGGALLSIAVVAVTFPISVRWRSNSEKQWFTEALHSQYMPKVARISGRISFLSRQPQLLTMFGDQQRIYGNTNADGSITIWFQGRRNYLRGGYLYQSAGAPDESHGVTIKPLQFLTNDWYAY